MSKLPIVIALFFIGCVHKGASPNPNCPDAGASSSSDGSGSSGSDGGGDGGSSVPDAGCPVDAANGSDGSSGSGDGSSSSYTCTPIAGGACCVFDANICTNGNVCQYDYQLDNSTFTSPSQGGGTCHAAGTLALGASCNVNAVSTNSTLSTCGQGAWCAYDANSGTTGLGVCRKLCDPLDQAAHGCQAGATCVGMLYCASAGQWPNCPSASNTHLGFCQ